MNELIDRDEIIKNAMSIWPDLVQKAGFEAANYSPITLKVRTVIGSSRVVVLLLGEGVENLVLKAEYPVPSGDNFQSNVDGHLKAYKVLVDVAQLHVPKLHLADELTESQLFEYVPGRPVHELFELAELGIEDRHKLLSQCGQWIGRFHTGTFVRLNRINPDVMLNSMAGLVKRVESRDHEVPRRGMFLECAAKIPAMGEAIRGQETRISATHGDLHLRNLMIDGEDIYGIDFSAMRDVPTAHDVAQFLVRFGSYFYEDLQPDATEPFSVGDLDAFYRGYGEEHRQDPALKYLLPIQLLQEWARIPKDKNQRIKTAQKRLHGILKMAQIVFKV